MRVLGVDPGLTRCGLGVVDGLPSRRLSMDAVGVATSDALGDVDQRLLSIERQIEVDAEGARKILRLIDALEDSDDVQNVYANFDASDEVMAELEED